MYVIFVAAGFDVGCGRLRGQKECEEHECREHLVVQSRFRVQEVVETHFARKRILTGAVGLDNICTMRVVGCAQGKLSAFVVRIGWWAKVSEKFEDRPTPWRVYIPTDLGSTIVDVDLLIGTTHSNRDGTWLGDFRYHYTKPGRDTTPTRHVSVPTAGSSA